MKEQQIHAYDSPESSRFVINYVLTNGELPEKVLDLVMKGSKVARYIWPALAMAKDWSEARDRIKVDTKVIVGGNDKVEVWERVKKEVVDRIEGAKMVVISKRGHLVPREAAKEVANEIAEFVEE